MRALCLLLVGGVAFAGGRPPDAIDADRANAEAEVRDLERRAQALEAQQEGRRERLKQRLRALYKLTNGGSLRLLAGADSIAELDARRTAVRRIVGRDLQELAAVRAEQQELDGEQARRKEALARALDFGAQVARADQDEPVGLGQRQGQLPRPVAGAVVGGFGAYHDAASGLFLARRGVELRSRAGEPVRAVAAGQVRFVGDVPGLGRGLIVDHGDGYVTLTARLAALRCQAGETLGDGATVGEAAGDRVYFELAQAGTPIDPARWLARASR